MAKESRLNNNRVKKRLPAAERRKVILDAALETFAEFGYHGALMDTIAERAQVTKPILYRHFPSKLDLLLAIIDRAGENLRRSLLKPDTSEVNWINAIRSGVRSYFDFVERSESGFRLIYDTDLNVDKRSQERVTEIRSSIIELVKERISYYTDTDAVPPERIYITSVMIVGMVESTVIHWMNFRNLPREVYEENLVRGVANILAQLPPRQR
ncbi:MAG: TetR/AcrR family transcriptional regulator [Actinomycetota bacterium]